MTPTVRKQLQENGYCPIWRDPHWYIYQPESGVVFRENLADEPRIVAGVSLTLGYALYFLDDLPSDRSADFFATGRLCYCKQVETGCDFCVGIRPARLEAKDVF